MEVNVKTFCEQKIDIDYAEAFRILCRTVFMPFVLEDDDSYYVSDDGCVWKTVDGKDTEIDDRGELFIALRNVVVNLFPNVSFRSAPYIYSRKK